VISNFTSASCFFLCASPERENSAKAPGLRDAVMVLLQEALRGMVGRALAEPVVGRIGPELARSEQEKSK
jgi:hypothetical protein